MHERTLVQSSCVIGVTPPVALIVKTVGLGQDDWSADDITNGIEIAFDCRPGASSPFPATCPGCIHQGSRPRARNIYLAGIRGGAWKQHHGSALGVYFLITAVIINVEVNSKIASTMPAMLRSATDSSTP